MILAGLLLPASGVAGSWIWWEGEKPSSSNFPASTWLSPSTQAEHNALSAGNILTAVNIKTKGPYWANYSITVTQAGPYRLYARKIWQYGAFKWQFDGGTYQYASYQLQLMDNASYIQYFPLNWVYLGDVSLTAGGHTFRIEMNAADWPNDPYYPNGADLGGFDAFILSTDPFMPHGKLQPGQKYGLAEPGKWNFEPNLDDFTPSALLDLRSLNEALAGQSGYVRKAADQSGKLELGDGTPVRFWGANLGNSGSDLASFSLQAQFLAKRGVNLVRYLDLLPACDPANINAVNTNVVDNAQRIVAAFKQAGIYTELDFYYALDFTLRAAWGLPGYTNDVTGPTVVVMFDDTLKAAYKQWVTQMFTATNPYTGIPLAQDPALAVIELQNEDSFFFWTFTPTDFPQAELENLETKFGTYLIDKYGSIAAAQVRWEGFSLPGDAPANGKMGLAEAWYMTDDDTDGWFLAYTPRMADQIAFLAELQRGFYREMGDFFRNTLGCQSLIESCNWTTADQRFLWDVERYTYTPNDVMDQHRYFASVHVDPASPGTTGYEVNAGDYYQSLAVVNNPHLLPSALKQVAGYPNIVSESTWCNPNRFKAEGPLLIAAYNSLADVDGWIWFATSTLEYDDSVEKFPLALPSLLGQFPGAALLYRRGDVQTQVAVRNEVDLNRAYDKQMSLISPFDATLSPPDNPVYDPATGTGRLDPLAMLAGRVECDFLTQDASNYVAANLFTYLDTTSQAVQALPPPSAAQGQLKLDWGAGLFQVNTPCSQGVCGFLNQAPSFDLDDVTIASSNQFGALLVISMDGLPLAQSHKILIQAMTEDNPYGWQEQDQVFTNNNVVYDGKEILSLGQPPMNVVNIAAALTFKGLGQTRTFGAVALDENGYGTGYAASRVVGADLQVTLPANSLYTVLLEPPAITNQPQSLAVVPGSNVVFSVGAIGPQPLSYQWLFNGVPLAGAANPTLTLTNVAPAGSGSYCVVVTNWAGSTTSALAALTVLPAAPPTVLSVTQSGGRVAFRWSAATGQTYQVQYTTDLRQPDWANLVTVSATNSSAAASDSLESATQRFYRILWLP